MRKAIGLSVFVLVIACTGTAWAQTPDGETPAEETVCDGLPGPLFGLCNAYCEAMDCDSGQPNASARACERVLSNFHRHSGGADPPCLANDCCAEPGSNDVPGCNDAECEDLICGFDPFCCDVAWDSLCVAQANNNCPVCGAEPPPPPV